MKKGLFVLAAVLAVSSFASASTTFDDGNFDGATVTFVDVGEDNNENGLAEGWFGAPLDPEGAGDSLYFTPNAFSVESSNGSFALPENGQIWFTVDAKSGKDKRQCVCSLM